MNEKIIERYLKKQVEVHGGVCYKWQSPSQRGVPDRIVIFRSNKVIFVEVKSPIGSLTKLQQIELINLNKMGCYTEVVYTKGDVDEFILNYAYSI